MMNKIYLKKYFSKILTIIFIFLLVYIIINFQEQNEYKRNMNYKINSIITLINEKYPNVKKEDILKILNENNNNYENILLEYGYDINTDNYIKNNIKISLKFTIIKYILLVILLISYIYIFISSHNKNSKEIDKIIKLIEEINHKNYELNLNDLDEDKLSILKQEIYKTTIMLKENAENSLKDKISLKNSLEDISHQLKTPLTSINILLDNILDEDNMDIKTRQGFIRQIKREISNITNLVETLLKLSKFEVNAIVFNRKEILVNDLIDKSLKNISSLCDLKGIVVEVKNNCKNKINCDSFWQIEALTNILKNAVEHSHNNGTIIIECLDNELYTKILIKDFGIGIDNEDLLNIFKRFYKGKNSSKDSVGIGLSLAKTIIEKDNGIVSVSSTKNKGTTFEIKYFYNI